MNYHSCSPRRVCAPALLARTPIARVVYLHLLVGEIAGRIPGLVRVGVFALAEEVALDPDDVRRALAELAEHGLVEVDDRSRMLRLPGVAEDAAKLAATPNVVIGWARHLAEMPDCPIRAAHAAVLWGLVSEGQRRLFDPFIHPSADPSPTLRQGFPNPPQTPPASIPEPYPHTCPIKYNYLNQDLDQETPSPRSCAHTAGEPASAGAPGTSELALVAQNGPAIPPDEPAPTNPADAGLDPPPRPSARRRQKQPSAAGPDELAVLQAWHTHRVALDLVATGPPSTVSPAQARAIAALDRESWIVVLRRAAEQVRRDAERDGTEPKATKAAEYFTLISLGRQDNAQRYLDADVLDQRLPARPRGGATPRARTPITPDRVYENRSWGLDDETEPT